MGATVSTGKFVSAFNGIDGKPYYVLWEQTYEKNCYPHTPKWSCWTMGTLENVLRRIFRAGSACEGGMLQRQGGNFTPEGYVAGWLKELANPARHPDRTITLAVGGGFYDAIQTASLDQAKQVLANAGSQAVADALENERTVNLSLHGDIELLDALYQGEVVYAWRMIQDSDMPLYGTRAPELGYNPAKVKAKPFTVPSFMRIDARRDDMLIQNDDGSWRPGGWEYSVVADYVTAIWEDELREPGTMRARMKAFRESLKQAPVLNKRNATVIADTNMELESYDRRNVLEAAEKLSCEAKDGVFQWNVPEDESELYNLCRLPPECTKWVVSDKPAPANICEQLSFLAA